MITAISNQPTVLIVDDERINRTALAELLKDECRVVLAKDGASALQRVAEEPISLILLDASMPDMDGYEVLRHLKSNEKTAKIGVIFVTGQIEEAQEERGLLLGAVDYIAKPVRPLLVKARVRNQLELARQREELERLSLQDALTGIGNRRAFNHAFLRACGNTVRTGKPLGLAMIDVDYFKRFNDFYGHGAGDDVHRRVRRIDRAGAGGLEPARGAAGRQDRTEPAGVIARPQFVRPGVALHRRECCGVAHLGRGDSARGDVRSRAAARRVDHPRT